MDNFTIFTGTGSKTFSNIDKVIAHFSFDINQYITFQYSYVHSRLNGNPNNVTLLGMILGQNSLSMVKRVLEHPNINVHKPIDSCRRISPLQYANERSIEYAKLLLQHPSFKVNKVFKGDTPLILFCRNCDYRCVKEVLRFPTIDVNYRTKSRHTALSIAAGYGHIEIVTALLAAPTLKPSLIRQAVKQAAKGRYMSVLKLCIEHQTHDSKKHVNRSRRQALAHAYNNKDFPMIQYLETLVRMQSKDIYYKKYQLRYWTHHTPSLFEQFIQDGHIDLIKHVLITYKPINDKVIKDACKIAIDKGNIQLVQILGYSMTEFDLHESVHNALFKSHVHPFESFKEWIQSPLININYVRSDGTPFIVEMVQYAPINYVKVLLDQPILNLYARDANNQTAYEASAVWTLDCNNPILLKEYMIKKENIECKALTEICLFSKTKLPFDVESIVASFLKSKFCTINSASLRRKIRKVYPRFVQVAEDEDEEEEEEEEYIPPPPPPRRVQEEEPTLHIEEEETVSEKNTSLTITY